MICDNYLNHPGAFYTFDISVLKKRIAYLRKVLPENIDLCYAVKANTFIIGEIIDCVERFEICSPGESEICDKLNVPKNKTVISGLYKTPSFTEELIKNTTGRIYTIESLLQYDMINEYAKKYNNHVDILLRLTNDSQFGMNREDIENIIVHRNEHEYTDILGIQFFSGTQKTSVKKIGRELRMLDAFILHLKEDLGYCARELEYGTGFPAVYFEEDNFDEENYFKEVSELFTQMQADVKITIELGRSIAATCGRYYTDIVDIKRNGAQNYAITDGGMHHIVYYGQAMAMKHPSVFVCGKENEEKTAFWNVCGSLCSMNDIIVKQLNLPEIAVGDRLCFENAGAYCVTEGISLFLSRDFPAVYLIKEDGTSICVRETVQAAQFNLPSYERNF